MDQLHSLTGITNIDLLILQNLSDENLAQVCRVNKYLYGLCSKNTFWLNRVLQKYGKCLGSIEDIRRYKGNKDWKDYYILLANILAGDKNRALVDSSKKGRIEVVRILLENGTNVHVYDDYALRLSSEKGHIEVVKVLLEKGADVHARDDEALRWASYNGHVEVVNYLLENGANVHAQNDFALRLASRNGHVEVVKVLLEDGANVHANDDYALRWASNNGDVEVVNLLKMHI